MTRKVPIQGALKKSVSNVEERKTNKTITLEISFFPIAVSGEFLDKSIDF